MTTPTTNTTEDSEEHSVRTTSDHSYKAHPDCPYCGTELSSLYTNHTDTVEYDLVNEYKFDCSGCDKTVSILFQPTLGTLQVIAK